LSRRPKQTRKKMAPKEAVLAVIRRLHAEGYQALLAGGCVRDMLLEQRPKDYDVATNALPATVTGLFERTLTVGEQFGVVVVLLGGRQIEVATFRSDAAYTDGRRPSGVVFTDARHDAQRRDFTINGMFMDPLEDRLIDYVGGQRDLKAGLIRAIGNAEARFAEDHLRILRAVRFACRLGFDIEASTFDAMQRHAEHLCRISPERVAAELEMILVDPNRVRGLTLARQSGIAAVVLRPLGDQQLDEGMVVVEQLPRHCSFAMALAALLTGCDGSVMNKICRALRTSNEVRRQAHWLLTHRQSLLGAIPLSKGRLKQWLAEPLFEPLVDLARCVLRATAADEAVLDILHSQIRDLGDEPVAPPRLLDGHDLMRLGVSRGPMLGQALDELYLAQLEGHVGNKAEARSWVDAWLARHRRC